jgi:hypothetical protein
VSFGITVPCIKAELPSIGLTKAVFASGKVLLAIYFKSSNTLVDPTVTVRVSGVVIVDPEKVTS